jgi:hypothetical protein
VVTETPHTATLPDVAKAVAFRGGELSEDTKLVGSAGFVNVVGVGVGMPFLLNSIPGGCPTSVEEAVTDSMTGREELGDRRIFMHDD